jgi:hypothetical protein
VAAPHTITLAVALLFAGACAHGTALPGDNTMPSHLTAKELERAVELAERVVAVSSALDQLKLTSAVNMTAGRDYRGPAYWRVTFKRRDLIPKDSASELGAGGEIFVDVDLDTNVARISGHGE